MLGPTLVIVCSGAAGCVASLGQTGADAGADGGRDLGNGRPDASQMLDVASVEIPPSATAWRPFADSSPWNTRIAANAALHPDSAELIEDFSSVPGQDTLWMNIDEYGIPLYWVDSTNTQMVNVMAGLGGTGFRTGAPAEGDVEGRGLAPIPPGAMPAPGTDRHLLVVDRQTRMEWGFFNAARSGATWRVDMAATQDLAGSGVRPPKHDSPWWAGHGPRACGFGLMAGLITVDEIKAGRIEHALVIAYPHIRSRYYTPPASTAQGTFAEAQPDRGIMCGGRIQLDPGLDVTTLGLSRAGVAIARALQEYGAFVGDYSGAMSLYVDSSADAQAYWATGVLDGNTAGEIPLDRFRVMRSGTVYDDMN